MTLGHFSNESLAQVNELLFAEDLEGQCDQKKKREAQAKQRTPEQKQADQERAQEMKGRAPQVSEGVRQEAAKKAAATRAKCNPPKPEGTDEAKSQPSQYQTGR